MKVKSHDQPQSTGIKLYRGNTHSAKYACFHCRLCFHRPCGATPNPTCTTCKRAMNFVGTAFRAPRRANKKDWAVIEQLVRAGTRFNYCGGVGIIPTNENEAKKNIKLNRTKPILAKRLSHRYGWEFDPCAVAMLNFFAWENPNLRIVIASHRVGMLSSSHNQRDTSNKQFWLEVFAENGLNAVIHNDWITERHNITRPKIDEIRGWLRKHPEITTFVTIDDEAAGYDKVANHLQRREFHLCAESYSEGITYKDFERMAQFLGITDLDRTLDKYFMQHSNPLRKSVNEKASSPNLIIPVH